MQVSTPDVREDVLTSEDEVLIMASDGLWDVIANQEAINIIKDTPVRTAPLSISQWIFSLPSL